MSVDKSVIAMLREFQEEGKPDFIKELFDLFSSLTPSTFAKIEKALEKGDLPTVAKAGHTLKSQAGNLGAQRLSILSGELELLARSESPSMDRIVALFETIRKEYDDVERELRAILVVG